MLNVTIKGLDDLPKKLTNLQKALHSIEGEIATVSLTPNDQASVDRVILEMERTVDRKVAPFRGDSTIDAIVSKAKVAFKQALLRRVKEERARL